MKHIFWAKELTVGISTIDNQHLQLVTYINTLMSVVNDGNLIYRKQRIDTVLHDIGEYAQNHFNFEELLIDGTDYKLLKILKQKHNLQIKKIAQLKNDLNCGKINEVEMQKILHNWILEHISNDKNFSRNLLDNFCQNKEINSGAGHNYFSMDLAN